MPFDFEAVLASDAFREISFVCPPADPTISTAGIHTPTHSRLPVQRPTPRATQNESGHRINLGVYNVEEYSPDG